MIGLNISPYTGATLLNFFVIFFSRMFKGSFCERMYIDDLQVIIFLCLATFCSLVSVFIVLKKMAMYANAISHTVLFGLVSIYLIFPNEAIYSIKAFSIAAFITAAITGALIRLTKNIFKVSEENSTALVFSLLFSMSLIMLVFLTKNIHIGTELILGNADFLLKEDLRLSLNICLFNAITTFICFPGLVCLSFDHTSSYVWGMPVRLLDCIIILMVSMSVIGSFKAVGVLMSLAFLLIPGLIAKLLAKSAKGMIGWSLIMGWIVALISPALSRSIYTIYKYAISTAALAVVCLVSLYLAIFFMKRYSLFVDKASRVTKA